MSHPSNVFQLDEEGYTVVKFVTLPVKVVDYYPDGKSPKNNGAVVRYTENFFDEEEDLGQMFLELKEYAIGAKNDKGNFYGVEWVSERRTIQISDPGVPVYKYKGSSAKKTESWSSYPVIEYIRDLLYDKTGYYFNFCLYNNYTPTAKLGWHSDSEKNMVDDSPIASISIGLKMRFRVRTIGSHTILFDDYLESGSCLIMEKQMQKLTEHCVWSFTKKELESIDPDEIRVNLTFRMMVPET